MDIKLDITRRATARQLLFLIIAVAVLLRIGIAIYLGDSITDIRGGTADQVSYDALAQRVIDGYGFSFAEDGWPYVRANQPTAFWSYLYTVFLAGIYGLFGHHPLVARLIQAVIVGLLMPLFVFRVGQQIFNEKIGLLAAAIVAIYAYFITFAGALMTESLYIVGIFLCVDIALRINKEIVQEVDGDIRLNHSFVLRYGIELGLAFGVTMLLRQVIVPFLVILALWLLWQGWRQENQVSVLPVLVIAGLITLLLLAPFNLQNYRNFGRITFMPNTNSGFAFYWSNHPVYGTKFEPVLSGAHGVSYQELIPEELRDLNEMELDKALMLRGIEFVRDEPFRFLLLSLSRIPVYFQFWPTADSTFLSNAARVMSFGLFLPLMILGLLLVLREFLGRLWRPSLSVSLSRESEFDPKSVQLILLFVGIYTAIHLASWANMRYRLPIDAFMIMFAAYGIYWVIERWRGSYTRLKKTNQMEELGEYRGI